MFVKVIGMSTVKNKECWKPVLGYEGWYEVSNHGRIQRVRLGSNTYIGRILKPKHQNSGYVTVSLCMEGVSRDYYIHILVCEAFHGPKPSPLHEVNHKGKDGDKTNNNDWNLEWVTDAEQQLHRFNVLKKSTPSGNKSKLSKTYVVTTPKGITFKIKGITSFCKQNGLTASAMIKVAKGNKPHHKKWSCAYVE